ncbi:MAG: hypothetical protein NC048_02225 [Bacteroides sp.]|nr:hypothetical protein [Ruminococcus flavefaciens]MCM1554293.1 hypothetical protein [Bacteroides sp.]
MKNLKKLDLHQITREELANTRGGDGGTSSAISIATERQLPDRENFIYDDKGVLLAHYIAYSATPVRAADTSYTYLRP